MQILRKIMLMGAVLLLPFTVTAQNVVKQGSWNKVLYTVQGSWKIVQNGSKLQVVLGDDFSTTNAPDLNIVLSPYDASRINSDNAMKNVAKLGLLQGKFSWRGALKGPFTLDIPKGIDLSKYKSIIIHCIAYSKTWAVGKL